MATHAYNQYESQPAEVLVFANAKSHPESDWVGTIISRPDGEYFIDDVNHDCIGGYHAAPDNIRAAYDCGMITSRDIDTSCYSSSIRVFADIKV